MEQQSKKSVRNSKMGLIGMGVSHKRLPVKPPAPEVVTDPTLRERVKEKLAKFNLDKVFNAELSD